MSSHTLTVGAILSASWGYDQTNVNFYMVTRTTPTSVYVVEVEKLLTDTGANYYATPCVDRTRKFPSALPVRKKVHAYRGEQYVRLTDYKHAYEWDGSPQYQTGLGGH